MKIIQPGHVYICIIEKFILHVFTIAMDTMYCESQIKICTRKCNTLYKKVRRSCKEILNRRPVCLQSCTAAVKDLLENEVGNTIWHCENPKGRLRKIRNAYSRIC